MCVGGYPGAFRGSVSRWSRIRRRIHHVTTASNPATGGSPDPASATLPTRIHADRGAGTLELEWADGHLTTYVAHDLRWLCPCAHCRGEAGMPGWLDTNPTLSDEQTRMVDIHLVGNYAVAPEWADGHHTGYYTFTLLRDRCPCGICATERAAAHAHHHEEPAR